MILTMLSENDKAVLSKLLDYASDEFTNHGCNDYPLPNTPENRELYAKVLKREIEDGEYEMPDESAKQLYFNDWLLMSYLGFQDYLSI